LGIAEHSINIVGQALDVMGQTIKPGSTLNKRKGSNYDVSNNHLVESPYFQHPSGGDVN